MDSLEKIFQYVYDANICKKSSRNTGLSPKPDNNILGWVLSRKTEDSISLIHSFDSSHLSSEAIGYNASSSLNLRFCDILGG